MLDRLFTLLIALPLFAHAAGNDAEPLPFGRCAPGEAPVVITGLPADRDRPQASHDAQPMHSAAAAEPWLPTAAPVSSVPQSVEPMDDPGEWVGCVAHRGWVM